MKRKFFLSAFLMLLVFTISSSAWAFPDIKGDPNEAKINELKRLGIVAGGKGGAFQPKGQLTYAAGVSLIVKGLDLTIPVKFIKKPEASDYFTKVKDNVWYSDAFITAHFNKLDIDKDVDPNAVMTREQFAHHLYKAMIQKGDFAFIDIFMNIADAEKVTPEYMDSIQKLLISNIITLDKNENFKPQDAITRGVAAGWLHDTIAFVKKHGSSKPAPGTGEPSSPITDAKLTVSEVNDDILAVTVSATVPHPGYGMKVSSITFEGSKALIHIEPVMPAQDRMYPQVITEVKTTTYIPSSYTAELAKEPVKDLTAESVKAASEAKHEEAADRPAA